MRHIRYCKKCNAMIVGYQYRDNLECPDCREETELPLQAIDRLEAEVKQLKEEIVTLTAELTAARQEVERKQTLIDKMEKALVAAIGWIIGGIGQPERMADLSLFFPDDMQLADLQELNRQRIQQAITPFIAEYDEAHRKELTAARARIAALESAQEWRPASEPPGGDRPGRNVEGQSIHTGFVYTVYCFDGVWKTEEGFKVDIIRWRDLSPLPDPLTNTQK